MEVKCVEWSFKKTRVIQLKTGVYMKDWTWNRWRSIDIGSTIGSMIRREDHLGLRQGIKPQEGN